MRVLAILHQADAGPGVFEQVVQSRGARLDRWRPDREQHPPRDPVGYDAVMTFGGEMNPTQDAKHPWIEREKAVLSSSLDRGVPVLGVCLGAQMLAAAAGAEIRRATSPEIGWYEVQLTEQGHRDPLLGPAPPRFMAAQWHSYEALLPPGAVALAHSATCLQAFRLPGAGWGIQFHAEVTLSGYEAWIEDYRSDEDAVRMGLDPEALRARTRAAIDPWNRLGGGFCERFLDFAASDGGA